VPTREEQEVIEQLRRANERLLMIMLLLEKLIELERPRIYHAPTGFKFVSTSGKS